MMSIPRTVSSNISICKRMKTCGEHPFTFPPYLVALKRHLLFSLVSNVCLIPLGKKRVHTQLLPFPCSPESSRTGTPGRRSGAAAGTLLGSRAAGRSTGHLALPDPNSWAFFAQQNKKQLLPANVIYAKFAKWLFCLFKHLTKADGCPPLLSV